MPKCDVYLQVFALCYLGRIVEWGENNLSSLLLVPFQIAKDFIRHLLEKNPDTRFSCEEALRHPW